MSLCKRSLILVGSSQEYNTLRNPFRIETRIDVIKETYPGISEEILMIKRIKDLTNEFDITTD
ncbi:bifunctional nicotinamide mononucleotide adenylyltransferase/ADP-ribose pyrophosphatase [compost metagenome]